MQTTRTGRARYFQQCITQFSGWMVVRLAWRRYPRSVRLLTELMFYRTVQGHMNVGRCRSPEHRPSTRRRRRGRSVGPDRIAPTQPMDFDTHTHRVTSCPPPGPIVFCFFAEAWERLRRTHFRFTVRSGRIAGRSFTPLIFPRSPSQPFLAPNCLSRAPSKCASATLDAEPVALTHAHLVYPLSGRNTHLHLQDSRCRAGKSEAVGQARGAFLRRQYAKMVLDT